MLGDHPLFASDGDDPTTDNLSHEQRQQGIQRQVLAKATARRSDTQSFLTMKPSEPLSKILAGIEAHPLWLQSFGWKWGQKCVLILVDPSCGPDGPHPTKAPPMKAQLETCGFTPRLQAAIELTAKHGSCLVAVPDGHRFANRRYADSIIDSHLKILKGVKMNERMLCTTFKHGQFHQRSRGVASDPDWETCSLHSAQEFFEVKTQPRTAKLGGHQSSSRCYEKMTMMGKKDIPGIDLALKQKIWNGLPVNSDQLKLGTHVFRKNVQAQWRNQLAM